MDIVQKSINAIQQAASKLQNRVTSNFGWAGQQAQQNIVRPIQQVAPSFNRGFNDAYTNTYKTVAQPIATNYAKLRNFAQTDTTGLTGSMIVKPVESIQRMLDPKVPLVSREGLKRWGEATIASFPTAMTLVAAPSTPVSAYLGNAAIGAGFNVLANKPSWIVEGLKALSPGLAVGLNAIGNPQRQFDSKESALKLAREGAIQGAVRAPTMYKITSATNPIINKFSSKLGAFLGSDKARQLIAGVASIPEGMLINAANGRPYTKEDLVLDFVMGAGTSVKVGDNIKKAVKESIDSIPKMTPEESLRNQQGFAKLDEPIAGTGKPPTGRIQNQDLLNEARKYKSAEEFERKIAYMLNLSYEAGEKGYKYSNLLENMGIDRGLSKEIYHNPSQLTDIYNQATRSIASETPANQFTSLDEIKARNAAAAKELVAQGVMSAENQGEIQMGWKPDQKDLFDKALANRDVATIKKMLPDVPEYFKKEFATEINAAMGKAKLKPVTKEYPATKNDIIRYQKTQSDKRVTQLLDTVMSKMEKIDKVRVAETPLLPAKYESSARIEVSTRSEALKILRENPNANVVIKLKPTNRIQEANNMVMELEKDALSQQALNERPLTTLADVEKALGTYIPGYKADLDVKGQKQGAGVVSDFLRQVEGKASEFVRQGELHPNPAIRNFTRLLQGFSGGMGKTRQEMVMSSRLKGSGINYANEIANDARTAAQKILDNPQESLKRIHAVLSPELSKLKVNESDLNLQEKEVLGIYRVIADYINDTNFELGKISRETWAKNVGGKYAPNIYDEFEYPKEINDLIQHSNIKSYEGMYKPKGEVTDWKQDHVIQDPMAAIAKRMNQTIFNEELTKYFSWITKTDNVSNVERPGYVKLSDSSFFGDASGKWIRKTILDDVKGQFFTNKIADDVYRALDWYDKNPVRQFFKKLFTIWNPGTQFGNIGSNYVFSAIQGVDPVTFSKNNAWGINEIKNKGPIYRQAIQDGIIGTDILRGDIVRSQTELEQAIKDPNIIKKIIDMPEYVYGQADDVAKISSLKTWLDKGFSWEEAARRTYNAYQNYRYVGWLYNLGAKVPVIGNPFVRFAGDMVRIVKNSAVDHPLALASTVTAWKLLTDIMSKQTGETPEERKVREQRFGSPHIPGTDISLAVQTPWGEVNIARLVGASAYMTEGTQALNDFMRFMPFQNPLDIRKTSDPLLGPIAQLALDTDFRGKSISDPNQTKFKASTLTPIEQNINRAQFLARAYIPKYGEISDIVSAAQGKEDYYGRTKTLPQQLLRSTLGVKVEQYGPTEVQKQIERDMDYKEGQNKAIDQRINSVLKGMLRGEVDETVGNDRIDYLNSLKTKGTEQINIEGGLIFKGNEVKFNKQDGNMQTYDLSKFMKTPTTPIAQKMLEYEAIKFGSTVMENENLTEDQKAQILSKLPVNSNDVMYYNSAGMPTEIKEMMLQEQIKFLVSQGRQNEVFDYLGDMRRSVAGRMMLTDTIVNKLYDEGVISQSEQKALKATTVQNGQKTIKAAKAKAPTMKKIKIPKLRAVKAVKSSKVKAVKLPKFKALKMPKIAKIKAK